MSHSPEPKIGEARWHAGGQSNLMAISDGWVMARRPNCAPYTMLLVEWNKLQSVELGRSISASWEGSYFHSV